MPENTKEEKVMILTRRVLDLKAEKKAFNKSHNEFIKECENEIKMLVKQ